MATFDAVYSAIDFGVDTSVSSSRTRAILALNDFLGRRRSEFHIFYNADINIYAIQLDADMERINDALRAQRSTLKDIADDWPQDYKNVLRALFARDTSGADDAAQHQPFAEAYLARVLHAAGSRVDWRSVLAESVGSGRAALVDAALVHFFERRDTSINASTLAQHVMLARERAYQDVVRILGRYIKQRETVDADFRRAWAATGIDVRVGRVL